MTRLLAGGFARETNGTPGTHVAQELRSPMYVVSLLSLCRRPRFASFLLLLFHFFPASSLPPPPPPVAPSSSPSVPVLRRLVGRRCRRCACFFVFFCSFSVTVTPASRYASSLNRPNERSGGLFPSTTTSFVALWMLSERRKDAANAGQMSRLSLRNRKAAVEGKKPDSHAK